MAKRNKTRVATARRRQEAAKAEPPPARVDLHEEYRYVIADLKRFGLLAVAMFALLIGLALVL